MSIEAKQKDALNIIENQITDFRSVVEDATKDENFDLADERLKRLKERTIRIISDKISQQEATKFENLRKSSWNMFDQLKNIRDSADMYINFLQVLKEGLEKYPDEILLTPTPTEVPTARTETATPKSTSSRRVFVVHGRNENLRESMFNFLRALKLEPIEWNQAIEATRISSPYIGDILGASFEQAQALLVMFSGDDEARLKESLRKTNDPPYEIQLTPQSRPNVIFEAGMAIGMAIVKNQNRTILVQIGNLRPISDIAGRHITLLDNSAEKRRELATKLEVAGCKVDISGTDWLKAGNFE